MSWNFRCFRHTGKNWADQQPETFYTIHEVYYKNKGVDDLTVKTEDVGYTSDAIVPHGETVEELRRVLQDMLASLDKPVLDYK